MIVGPITYVKMAARISGGRLSRLESRPDPGFWTLGGHAMFFVADDGKDRRLTAFVTGIDMTATVAESVCECEKRVNWLVVKGVDVVALQPGLAAAKRTRTAAEPTIPSH